MMNPRRVLAFAGVVLAGTLLTACSESGSSAQSKTPKPLKPLHCYVGGTMRPVMQKLAKLYEAKTAQKVNIDSAGSGDLLKTIQDQQFGDLYVSHDPFSDMLMARGLGLQGWTTAVVTPVIVVPKGNPKHITSVKNLARPGLKLAMTDPRKSTAGHIVGVIFDKARLRQQIEGNIVKHSQGSGQAADWVGAGDVDAAILWNASAHKRLDKLDIVPIEAACVPIPGIDTVTSATNKVYDIGRIKVTIATLKCSKQPEAATKFAEFVVANRSIFAAEFGFSPAPDSLVAPKLSLHCDAALRPGIAEAVSAFEKKTGAKIRANYQDSGTLIAAIRLKQAGDLYLPRNVKYLDMLTTSGCVEGRTKIASRVPTITASKGKQENIAAPADLAIGLLKYSQNKPLARQFMDYLAGPEGQAILRRHHYTKAPKMPTAE